RDDRLRADREGHFHTPCEIARHPVPAGDIELRLATVLEAEDAAVLEEAIDHREHLDVLADSGYAGNETADAADQEVDLHPGARGAVERGDGRGIDQRIHLGRDARRFSIARVRLLALDHGDGPALIVHRS